MVTTLLITVAASLPLAEVYSRPHGIFAPANAREVRFWEASNE